LRVGLRDEAAADLLHGVPLGKGRGSVDLRLRIEPAEHAKLRGKESLVAQEPR
jgi:hypothetical protein